MSNKRQVDKYVEDYYCNKEQSNAKGNNLDESQTTQMVKNSPAMPETRFIAWEPLWTEDPGWLQSMGSQKSETQLRN